LSIQGQAIRAASAVAETPLPPEIAFLSRHGIDMDLLRQAAATAEAVGVTADLAAIKCDLLEEAALYKALADELGLPFLTKIRVADQARYPEGILAGLVPLAPPMDRLDMPLRPPARR
jgi:glycosyltransferase XagB